MNTFNDFANATTYVTINNMPNVAGAFKSAMLAYQYADKCEWYKALQDAKTVKAIFDVFGISFRLENNNFYPVIKDVTPNAGFKDALKAISPFVAIGSMYVKDDYRYYTLNFDGKSISGKVRTITDNTSNTPVTKPTPTSKPINSKPKKDYKPKKNTDKKYCKTEVRSDATISNIQVRDNNTYTVQELAQELIRQIFIGNGNRELQIEADFLFKDAEKTA